VTLIFSFPELTIVLCEYEHGHQTSGLTRKPVQVYKFAHCPQVDSSPNSFLGGLGANSTRLGSIVADL